jgi:hypothetical protein
MKRPTESRGPWHYEEALTSLEQLATARPDLGSLSELAAAVRDAQPVGYEWLALSVPPAEQLITTLLARPKALRQRLIAAADSDRARRGEKGAGR